MGLDIFESCDPGAHDVDLSKIEIDEKYARRLEHNKKREALHRLQDLKKQGRAGSDSDDSDKSDSDSDVPVPSTKEELDYARALNILKKKDPILKQPDFTLFSSDDDEDDDNKKRPRKEKPLYLKDVNAQHLLEEGPEFEDEPLGYHKEQSLNITAFLEADKEALGSPDDDLFKKKETGGGEAEADDDGTASEFKEGLDEFFGRDGDLNEDEMFLKGYLRERKWIDRVKENKISLDIDVDEDEDELERQEQYEATYNFRYEEPEQEDHVIGHARVTEGSVRKKTNSRKAQRKSKEERMAQAEFERKEELKHLKNLKKKEIQERLEKIRAIAGIEEGGTCKLDEDDLEEDFDPEAYDKKMREMFSNDYYEADDADPVFASDDEVEFEKPDFDKKNEALGFPKGWDACGPKEGFAAARERVLKQKEEEHEEEPQKEEGKRKRKRKRKITLKEKIELDKELEEYYKLDYEDTIGDLKTRFKYRPVQANSYNLRPEEILMSNDENLNQYVSLKKLAPYREDEWKVTIHQKKKKSMILQGDSQKVSEKHTKSGGESSPEAEGKPSNKSNGLSRRQQRRRRQAELKLSWSRLVAYGKIQPKPKPKGKIQPKPKKKH